MQTNTTYDNQAFISVSFLEGLGFLSDAKAFFQSAPAFKKIKVVSDADFTLAQQIATFENMQEKECEIVPWFVPVSAVNLCPVDKELFDKDGYIDLVDKNLISLSKVSVKHV